MTVQNRLIFTAWMNRGFTYVGALVLMVVTGIALTQASQYWSTIMKREKEKELLFRGGQIYRAIESYYNSASKKGGSRYPNSLKGLIRDSRYPEVRRHLRKLYRDPMTSEGEWGLILDGKGGIKGVYSKGGGRPLKRSGFPAEYAGFEKAKKYSDWKFVYIPQTAKEDSKK